MTPTTDDQIPPPPRFSQIPPDGEEEHDVDLGDEDQQMEQVLSPTTLPPGGDHLGSYPTLERFFRSQLEEEVSDACSWLLDCLDWSKVQRRWESDGSRLVCESGEVYRLAPPEPDHCGPWMPTRGA